MAFEMGSEGRRLPALKFVESVVLLYTPDPDGSMDPPSDKISEGKFDEFNISWLRGHPTLNVRDLSSEASKNLGLLLDQLRSPSLKLHSYLMIIVLIKSLLAVARKRPAFYGRILPVLLGLDPSSSVSKGMHLAGVHHALKNAFESCLNCTHPGAALDEKPSIESLAEHSNASRKRTGVPDSSELSMADISGKRARSTPDKSDGSGNEMNKGQDLAASSGKNPSSDTDSGPVQQLVAMFGVLVAQGEKAAVSLEILISSISADLLAEVVMANMCNFPPKSSKSEGDEEPLSIMAAHPEMIGSATHISHLSLLLTDILSQSRSSPEKETVIEDPHHAVANELEGLQQTPEEGPHVTLVDSNVAYDDLGNARQQASVSVGEFVSPGDVPFTSEETGDAAITSEVNDIECVENEIPGISSSTQDAGLPENMSFQGARLM
ncbi:hypothetical protein ACS0TY_015007 [Phlomoides rotata]